MLTNVGDIYTELYGIYKSKYNKKIDWMQKIKKSSITKN